MADTARIAQLQPAAATLSVLYTCPANTLFVGSTLVMTNTGSGADAVRVSVAPGGAADSLSQYLVYDVPVSPGELPLTLTIGITLGANDAVRVYSANGRVSFTLFGIEVA